MNLPNKLTLARCVLAAVFVGLMSFQIALCTLGAFVLFIAAVITDYLDGKIARSRNLVTDFGKLLDPVADKVLMVAGFVMLMAVGDLWIPPWAVVAIVAREFLVTGIRSLAAAKGAVIPANTWGKVKTTLQMTYVGVFVFLVFFLQLVDSYAGFAAMVPGEAALYRNGISWASMAAIVLVALYTVYTGVQFAHANWLQLKLKDSAR